MLDSFDELDFKRCLLNAFENYENTRLPKGLETIDYLKSELTKEQCESLNAIFKHIEDSTAALKKRLVSFVVDFFLISDKFGPLLSSSNKNKDSKSISSVRFD